MRACGPRSPSRLFITWARAIIAFPFSCGLLGIFITSCRMATVVAPQRRFQRLFLRRVLVSDNDDTRPDLPTTEPRRHPELFADRATCARALISWYSPALPVAPFTIRTEPGSSYLVKMPGRHDRSKCHFILVYGGQELDAKVPLGNYTLTTRPANIGVAIPICSELIPP